MTDENIAEFVSKCRKPYHGPTNDKSPCEDAYFVVELIAEIDYKFDDIMELKLGGAGDNGEILAGMIDLLIEARVLKVNRSAILPRIEETRCDCPRCGWTGTVVNCETDEDGNLCCPLCDTIVFVQGI